MRTLAFALLLTLIMVAGFGCASRPKASESDQLYYLYGGDNLRRKRTEIRQVERTRYNQKTGKNEKVTETVTVAVLEIETSDGRIVDYDASIDLANQLREGQPIPTISEQRAAKAGLIGDCVEVTRVVEGGAAYAGGVMEDDLIVRYNNTDVLGVRKLRELTAATAGQENITLVYERDGKQRQVTVAGGDLGIEGEDYWR